MQRKIIAGNWKMNHTAEAGESFWENLNHYLSESSAKSVEVCLFPTFLHLPLFAQNNPHQITLGGQNCFEKDHGAFTGEISAEMLQNIGVNAVLIGHSERRLLFNEDDAFLARKCRHALEKGMKVFYCVGEMLEHRMDNSHFQQVKRQLTLGLFDLPESLLKNLYIAYEPVWAIGTGKTASCEQAAEMHTFIRKTMAAQFSPEIASELPILYGGSVKPGNAEDLLSFPDINGALIGGCSLNITDFCSLIQVGSEVVTAHIDK